MTIDELRPFVISYVEAHVEEGAAAVVLLFVVRDGKVATQHGTTTGLGTDHEENVRALARLGRGLETSARSILGG
jgi:hypothetical protein